MLNALRFQGFALVVVSVLAWFMSGRVAAISAVIGGLASLLPNAFFALRLAGLQQRGSKAFAANFFIGEFVKIAASVGILVVAVQVYPEMNWLAMLVSLVATSQAGFFAFWKKS